MRAGEGCNTARPLLNCVDADRSAAGLGSESRHRVNAHKASSRRGQVVERVRGTQRHGTLTLNLRMAIHPKLKRSRWVQPTRMRCWLGVCFSLAVACARLELDTANTPASGASASDFRAGPNAARNEALAHPTAPDDPPGLGVATSARPVTGDDSFSDADIPWQANRVMQRLGRIAETMTRSEYSYGLRVNEAEGIYEFDCSGMAYWVLRKATPRAASALAYNLDRRPLARDIQRRIASIPATGSRHGWQRVKRVDALEPGDVVAWIKPKVIRSPNTGHVAFVVLPPQRVPHRDDVYLLRIADSTRLMHDADTRIGRNGFGFGTIVLIADPESGTPIAYGWAGLRWRTFETEISLGRPIE